MNLITTDRGIDNDNSSDYITNTYKHYSNYYSEVEIMKTFLVINSNGEHIHTPATLRDIAGTTRELMDIEPSSTDKNGTYAKVAVMIAEAIAKIRSNVPFNIANNRGNKNVL